MSALKKLKERSELRRKLLAQQFGTENTKDFSSILGEQERASPGSSSLSSTPGVKQSAGSAFAQTPYGRKNDSLAALGLKLSHSFVFVILYYVLLFQIIRLVFCSGCIQKPVYFENNYPVFDLFLCVCVCGSGLEFKTISVYKFFNSAMFSNSLTINSVGYLMHNKINFFFTLIFSLSLFKDSSKRKSEDSSSTSPSSSSSSSKKPKDDPSSSKTCIGVDQKQSNQGETFMYYFENHFDNCFKNNNNTLIKYDMLFNWKHNLDAVV